MIFTDPPIIWFQLGAIVVLVCALSLAIGLGIGALLWRRYALRGLKLAAENQTLRQALETR